ISRLPLMLACRCRPIVAACDFEHGLCDRLAEPYRRGIEVGAASARCRHPPGRQLPRIEREIPEPLRRRAGPGAIVDLAIHGDVRVLGADAAALALVDLPE